MPASLDLVAKYAWDGRCPSIRAKVLADTSRFQELMPQQHQNMMAAIATAVPEMMHSETAEMRALKAELAATKVELEATKAQLEAAKVELYAMRPKMGAATPALAALAALAMFTTPTAYRAY